MTRNQKILTVIIIFVSGVGVLFSTHAYTLLKKSYNSSKVTTNALPADWDTKEKRLVKGSESLLYGLAEVTEVYKTEKGSYPPTYDELKKYYNSITPDLIHEKEPRYYLSADKKTFGLSISGLDGIFDTPDDIVYDPQKVARNTLPMYGGKDAIATPIQHKANADFINTFITQGVSREEAASGIAKGAWNHFNQGDLETAMKRFNQVWLLDPKNSESYKGFIAILEKQGKTKDADDIRLLLPIK